MRKQLIGMLVALSVIQFSGPTLAQQPVTRSERATISRAIEQRIADLEVERPKQLFANTANSAEVTAIDQQLEQLRARLAALHRIARRAGTTRPVTGRERQTIVRAIEQRIAALEVDRPRLATRYAPTWPEIQSIDEQLAQLRGRLSELVYGVRLRSTSKPVVAQTAGGPMPRRATAN